MQLGDFRVPDFDKITAAVGADIEQYPPMSAIPDEHRAGRSKECNVASALFFEGGSLAEHGLRLKPGVDADRFYRTLRAYIASFAPQHEHKMATCGWLIETFTEPVWAA